MENEQIIEDYCSRFGPSPVMPREAFDDYEIDGVVYTILTNISGVLAVYGPDGFVPRDGWPEGMDEL